MFSWTKVTGDRNLLSIKLAILCKGRTEGLTQGHAETWIMATDCALPTPEFCAVSYKTMENCKSAFQNSWIHCKNMIWKIWIIRILTFHISGVISHYLVWKKKSQIYINSVNFPNAGGGELVVTTISFKFLFFIFLAIDFQPSFYPQFT